MTTTMKMRRALSQPLLRKHVKETDDDDDQQEQQPSSFMRVKPKNLDSLTKHANCSTISLRETNKSFVKGQEHCSLENYGAWKQGQKSGLAKLKKHLKVRWEMQKLIDEHLGRFKAHYCWAMAPTRMSNVAQLIMPKWAPPLELAAVSWLGDWRPSIILQFLLTVAPVGAVRALSQLINDIRIEEAVIDEEMAEIQANCVLHLPFGRNREGHGSDLGRIRTEFRKIHRVIVKAQKLRMKALELAVNKVLSQTEAAEFFVKFAGIQEAIHRLAVKNQPRQGPVVCPKELGFF